MIRIRELDHVVIRARDLDAMVAFYCDVLGCTMERSSAELGLVQLRAGRSLIDLVAVDGQLGRKGGPAPGDGGHNLDHFCVRVEPFDEAAIRGHLSSHGVATGPVEVRYGAEGSGPSMYIMDAEGNTVELKGPPSPVSARG